MEQEIPERTPTSVRQVRGKDRVDIDERTEEMVEQTYEEPAPAEDTGDFNYEALDELGDFGAFGDEDPNWLRDKPKKVAKKPVDRVKMRRTLPRRGSNPTMLRGLRP